MHLLHYNSSMTVISELNIALDFQKRNEQGA